MNINGTGYFIGLLKSNFGLPNVESEFKPCDLMTAQIRLFHVIRSN